MSGKRKRDSLGAAEQAPAAEARSTPAAAAAGPSSRLPSIYDKKYGGDKPQRFETGAALLRALSTGSADALRAAFQQLRIQFALQLNEEHDPTTIPASDARIQLVVDFCQLCELETTASSTSSSSSAAKPILTAWELAHKQNLVPLLPLPIFGLSLILPLLSAHFPNQSYGEHIINRLLSPTEPWFGYLQGYLANAANKSSSSSSQGKGKESHAARTPEITTIATLRLLKEIVSFGRGRFAAKVFESFNWGSKSLPKLFNMRKRPSKDKQKDKKEAEKSSKKSREPVSATESGVSLKRPDIRVLYILFMLAFLSQTYSSSLKIRMLDLGREHLPAMLKGIAYDSPDVVHHVLVHLHEDLVQDRKVPRAKKVQLLNEWACEQLLQLYSREHEHISTSQDGETVQGPSVAELVHHFMLSISTNPGFGVCFSDRGWYPRQQGDPEAAAGPSGTGDAEKAQEPRDSSSRAAPVVPVYNKVPLGILRRIAPTDDTLQQELALSILRSCPELVGPYLEAQCGSLTIEPRPSSRWLCNTAFMRRVFALQLPSFRNAKLERIDAPRAADSFLHSFASQPPPLPTVLANTLPTPLSRQLVTRGLNHQDRLVRHTTASLLCTSLERLSRFRNVCEQASAELDEDDNGAWRLLTNTLEIEIRKRLPEISIVIQMMQSLTTQETTGAPNGDSHVSNSNVLLMEVSLRLLWLYYLAVPSSAFDSRFDVGKLLSNSFMAPLSRVRLDEDGEPEKLSLQALCQVHALRIVSLSTEHAFDWTARVSASGPGGAAAKSYFGLLLSVYATTPLVQVRASCEELFKRLIAPSALFEHDPSELAAWLESLPATDADTSVISRQSKEETERESLNGTPDSIDALSEEQKLVIAFLDECAQRCMKTSYRYLEASRQFLSEASNDKTQISTSVSNQNELLASPMLMTMFEQFTIRAQKGLFDADAASGTNPTINALLAFFNRLLPLLAGSGRSLPALEIMAQRLSQSIESNARSSSPSSRLLASVLLASLMSLRRPPITDSMDTDDDMSKSDKDIFRACPTPLSLREVLRSAQRPLSAAAVAALFDQASSLKQAGFFGAMQLLGELHPADENLLQAIGSKFFERKLGELPLSHLLDVTVVPDQAEFSPFLEDDARVEDLEEWSSPVQAQLAACIAIFRLSANRSAGSQVAQTASVLRRVVESAGLSDDDLGRLVFSNPALLQQIDNKKQTRLLVEVSDLALEALEPTSLLHRRILSPLSHRVLALIQEDSAQSDALDAFKNMAAFFDDETLNVAATHLMQAVRSSSVQARTSQILEALSVCASLSSPAAVVKSFSSELELLFQLAIRLQADGSEAISVAFYLIDRTLECVSNISGALVGVESAPGNDAHGKPTVRAINLTRFDVGPLVGLETVDGADSLLVKAIYSSPENAERIARLLVKALTDVSESTFSVQHIARLASTLRASLEVFLVAQVGNEVWTRESLVRVGEVTCESLKSSDEDVYSLMAAFSLAHRACVEHSWTEEAKSIGEQLLNFVKDAKPKDTFREAILDVCSALLTFISKDETAKEIVQTTVDQSLLWLVRRFAEDENDNVKLVQLVERFDKLLQETLPKNLVTIKPHLADPVIQAALKNRVLCTTQMRLVLSLCRAGAFKTAQLSRYLSAILAHGELAAILNATAVLVFPDGDERAEAIVDDDEHAKAQLATEQQDHRLVVVQTIHAIVKHDPSELLGLPLVQRLMGAYGGTLTRSDRCLLDLFRIFEESCGSSFLSLARHWAAPSASVTTDALSDQNRILQALLSIDANVAFATCSNYPREVRLMRLERFRYRANEIRKADKSPQGDSSSAERYDPVFLLSLLAGVLVEQKLTGLHWLGILRSNVLGVVICGLSSQCEDMRRASLDVLGKCYASLKEISLSEKEYLLLVMDLLRGCISQEVFAKSGETAPALPFTTTLFVAYCLRSLAAPAHFTFPLVQRFLLQRPTFDATDVPLLYNMLFSSSENFRRERMWMLHFLRDCARSGGRAEWKIFKRRHVWELLATLYDGAEAVNGTEQEEEECVLIRSLVEDTTMWLVQNTAIATELAVRRGLLAWIAQQQQTMRGDPAIWVRMADALLSHADVHRLDRAWMATALSIVRAQSAAPDAPTLAASARIVAVVVQNCDEALRASLADSLDSLVGQTEQITPRPPLAAVSALYHAVLSMSRMVTPSIERMVTSTFGRVVRLALQSDIRHARRLTIENIFAQTQKATPATSATE